MNCPCCHAPAGLHTEGCHRAFVHAYDKAALDAQNVCKSVGEAFASQGHHIWQMAAEECAKACRNLTGHGS
jgi:hypothetical protein